MSILELDGRYTSIGGIQINMTGIGEMELNYVNLIAEILGMDFNPDLDSYYDIYDRIIKTNSIVQGVINHEVAKGGDWHRESGKCLYINAGPYCKNDKYLELIKDLTINIE